MQTNKNDRICWAKTKQIKQFVHKTKRSNIIFKKSLKSEYEQQREKETNLFLQPISLLLRRNQLDHIF